MHTMLQKPRTMMGSCVPSIKTTIIFCSSIGNEYYLHWQSSSLKLSNSSVTALPNSQYMKIGAKDQNAYSNGEINSIDFESSSGFKIEIKRMELSRNLHLIKIVYFERWCSAVYEQKKIRMLIRS